MSLNITSAITIRNHKTKSKHEITLLILWGIDFLELEGLLLVGLNVINEHHVLFRESNDVLIVTSDLFVAHRTDSAVHSNVSFKLLNLVVKLPAFDHLLLVFLYCIRGCLVCNNCQHERNERERLVPSLAVALEIVLASNCTTFGIPFWFSSACARSLPSEPLRVCKE